ncbi:hypothetical protein PT974_00101 [Cladobotryum mycophilum]|uniref:Phage portal protein n=1 Tax=Cladobotryum mycophilum TaxID=491253 RepID=A0ABR0T0I4_9HYPO
MPVRDEILGFIDTLEGLKEAGEFIRHFYALVENEPRLTAPRPDKILKVTVRPSDTAAFRSLIEDGETPKIDLTHMVNHAFSSHTDVRVHSVQLRETADLELQFSSFPDRNEFITSDEGVWLGSIQEGMKIVESSHQIVMELMPSSIAVDPQGITKFMEELNRENNGFIRGTILGLAWLCEPLEGKYQRVWIGKGWRGRAPSFMTMYASDYVTTAPNMDITNGNVEVLRDASGVLVRRDTVRGMARLWRALPPTYLTQSNAAEDGIHLAALPEAQEALNVHYGVPDRRSSDGLESQRILDAIDLNAISRIVRRIEQDGQLLAAVLEDGQDRAPEDETQELERVAVELATAKATLLDLDNFIYSMQEDINPTDYDSEELVELGLLSPVAGGEGRAANQVL